MIAKIAVSAATYAIDKPYSYKIPEGMTLQPGQRVQLPFGRANKRTEGVVLTVETGNEEKLKAVERCLDEAPILSEHQLRLAAFLRERYFCTFYECLRVMLPAGLWFQARERISLTGDRSWKEKAIRKDGAAEVLALLENLGGQAEEPALRALIPDEETFSGVIAYLARKKWISAETEYLRRANDKTEKIAALAVSAEEAMEYASHRPKSAAMQKNVLELMCGVGSVSVKELCYFTGASTATVNRLEKLGYLTLTEQPVLRCREIRPAKLDGPLVLSPDQQRCYDGLAKQMAQENPGVDVPVYGVPINTREALGVLHFKGFIIDDSVLYSGASLNDVYLHQHDKYRYDRYHLIRNRKMSDIMFEWVTQNIMNGRGVNRLDDVNRPKSPEIKNDIRLFRQELRDAAYHFQGDADNDQLSVTPLVGLGKSSLLNKTIFHLMPCAEQKLTICTPYFNLPAILVRNIIQLLREGKKVEIIVGDKTANDFYIPEDEPFKIIGALPYLYEINLRRFLSRLQYYVNTDQLVVRLWKDDDNTYHLKGMWVDDKWMLITGNNLNPRAWRLDLENAILIHDPQLELAPQREKELELIREHTTIVKHYRDLQSIADYPVKVRKLIRRLRRIRIDRLISRIL